MLAEMGVRVWAPIPAAPLAVAKPPAGRPASAPVATKAPAAAPVVAPTADRPPAVVHPAPTPAAQPSVAAPAPVATAIALTARPSGIDTMDWPALREAVANCRACALCEKRKNTVFGTGHVQADWFIVGEAPGENEDLQGEPFVGAAGQLLDNMLRAVGLSRSGEGAQGAYISNVLKCRPPANRNPQPAEVAQCAPYLARQVALVQPKIIIAMGRFAVQALLQSNEPIGKLRGQVHRYQGVPVIVTYHPAYLLRTPSDKAKAWADLCLAMETANTPLRR
ncbi:MAG: uracil-DNA glycosylase [Hydrogenophaga sp.]|uniref:uracil-DNA glycosylase n=1 Tax=Hydrogenophaga sp. TaxID=1904254 RepID=UPI002ABCCFAE|nr:uracil-DNA glycosylase [Hydrogenophaga sp.]MDZ4190208.1 uracil-DNA glycosylase [Hydrogenophaga sp.]